MEKHQCAYPKLYTRLSADELKPKGMHWHTYEHFIDRLAEIDAPVSGAFNVMAARLMKISRAPSSF